MRKITAGLTAIALFLMLFGTAAAHIVQPGETLWGISRQYGAAVADIAEANDINDVNNIEAGRRLIIPGNTVVHTVQPGETLWQLSRQYDTTVDAIAAENSLTDADNIAVGTRLIIPGTRDNRTDATLVSRGGRLFSAAELDLFARLVHAEAAGEPFLGQVAVAASVLNRIASPIFPDSLTAVIKQVAYGFYQYSPVLDGRINLPANESARRAVAEAISGVDPSLGATGFFNPAKTSNAWVRQQPVTTVIANHVFFR